MVDLNDSMAEFSQIENESVLPESEANLDEYSASIQPEEIPVQEPRDENDNPEKIDNYKPHDKNFSRAIKFK